MIRVSKHEDVAAVVADALNKVEGVTVDRDAHRVPHVLPARPGVGLLARPGLAALLDHRLPGGHSPSRVDTSPLLVASLLLALRIGVTRHGLWADLDVYIAGGRAVLEGRPLYDVQVAGLPFTYPPFAAVLFIPLTILPLELTRWLVTVRFGDGPCPRRAGSWAVGSG